MKTITFFSEKGGVGKSSFTIMYASWLFHKYGIKTAVADFNGRISSYREAEIKVRDAYIKENPGSGFQPFDVNKTWPIVNAYHADIYAYDQQGEEFPNACWFRDQVRNGKLKGYDVVICDFPGSLSGMEYLDLMQMNSIGLTVIPTDKDEMTLQSTLRLIKILGEDTNYCCFMNKANLLKNFRGKCIQLCENLVNKCGVKMLPDIVTNSERMTTIDKVDIIRSTFGFVDFTRPEMANISSFGIENLFIDVTKELEKTKDIPGTEKTDLSFVHALQKENDGRYFKGSYYPQYETFD